MVYSRTLVNYSEYQFQNICLSPSDKLKTRVFVPTIENHSIGNFDKLVEILELHHSVENLGTSLILPHMSIDVFTRFHESVKTPNQFFKMYIDGVDVIFLCSILRGQTIFFLHY